MRMTTRFAQSTLLVLGVVAVDASAQDVRTWLDRMNQAVEELNYEGTFVHVIGRGAETLHIVHRNQDGKIGERIRSLDGVGREIVRRDEQVQCILPDRRVVLLEETRDASPLVSTLPSYSQELEANYSLVTYQKGRVARRPTQVIGIKPKDDFRYGYLVWLDQDTGMPLKSQIRNENGDVVEQILFTDFQMFDEIPESALASNIDTDGFTWLRSPNPRPEPNADVAWRASLLPKGFKLSVATQSPMAGSEYPVEHLVYSDGLATVSVFIEDPKTESDVEEGFFTFGSTNAYSLTLRGRKVTAIGEVPRQTVQKIATSLDSP